MNASDAMNDAMRLHQAGRIDQAEVLYRRLLEQNANDAPALHMLGVLLGQRGDKQAAVEHITRAIALQPGIVEFHLNLALVFLETGDGARAADASRAAVATAPANHRAWNHLGNALKLMGQLVESIDCFQRALAVKPDFVPALRNLADTFRRLGREAEADACLDEALKLRPDDLEALGTRGENLLRQKKFASAAEVFRRLIAAYPQYWGGYNGLGAALFYQGQTDQSVPLFQKAVELEPHLAGPHNSLGHAYTLLHRIEQAIASLRTSLSIDPNSADTLNNLAYALLIDGRPDEAISLIHQAIAAQPGAAETYSNLGNALVAKLDIGPAMEQYNRSIYIRPDHAEAHWNKALLHLLTGDFATGWLEHEWRWMKFVEYRRNFRQPLWVGGDISGKTLLLHAEQGFGDSIQFSRFAGDVARRGATVILECPPALASLLHGIEGVSRVVARGQALPVFDFHCPLLSLPYALGIDSPEKIAPLHGYIHAPPAGKEAWAELLLPFKDELKVGLAWSGARKHARDHERSISPHLLTPLSQVGGVRFFNLQKPQAGVETALPPGLGSVDFADRFNEFADTAGLVAQLDLVITVDTSIAHLAGALGIETWTMIAFHPDWRWLLNRTDTPWYPSMRLFRQPEPRDWGSVIREVVAELRTFVSQKRG